MNQWLFTRRKTLYNITVFAVAVSAIITAVSYVLKFQNLRGEQFRLFIVEKHHSRPQATGEIFLNENCPINQESDTARPKADFRIIVLTYNRPESLDRLLNSINRAFYDTDKVELEIWIDKSKSNTLHMETVHSASRFIFQKGNCSIHIQPVHAGIKGQWLTTWTSFSTDEIAVILEDDLTVSPHFYRYLKLVHTKYRDRPDVAGFSLQGSSVRHSDGVCCLEIPFENKVFLYPTLGTSGFSPNNKNWRAFKKWYEDVVDKNNTLPLPENHISLYWFQELSKNGRGDTMWEMEYLYYTQKNKEYTLYPNFLGHLGLTFNWMEQGLHYSESEKRAETEEAQNIVNEWNLTLADLPDRPIYVDNSGKLNI